MTAILSRENPLIKDYVRLCADARYRRESGRFVLEGARLAEDAVKSGIRMENAFFTAAALEKHAALARGIAQAGGRIFEVSAGAAQKLADTCSAQGVFCTARMLDKCLEPDKIALSGAYLALENLQDPGNVGTMLRTAEALGFDGVFLSGNCPDIWSPKVIRAAMGAVFRLPFMQADDLPRLLSHLRKGGMRVMGCVAQNDARSILQEDFSGGIAAVIGNEGAGLSEECLRACTDRVTIPMAGRAESLNAAAAAAIVMWEIARRRL